MNWSNTGPLEFAMKCLPFLNREVKEEIQLRFSTSLRSNGTTSTDHNFRRSETEFNSEDVIIAADSMGRSNYPSLTQRPCNLRVFTFSELKNATRNFSRSLLIGEGGFGCVYRGTIKSLEDPSTKIEIAVKLSHKGLQVSILFAVLFDPLVVLCYTFLFL